MATQRKSSAAKKKLAVGKVAKAKKPTTKTTRRKTTAETKAIVDQKKRRKQQAQQIKRGVRQTIYGLYAISMVALLLMVLSVAFLVFNWKNVTIDRYATEVAQLQDDIQVLTAENKIKEGEIVKSWLKEERIVNYAKENLGLGRSLDQPKPLRVNKSRLNWYARKDLETQQKP